MYFKQEALLYNASIFYILRHFIISSLNRLSSYLVILLAFIIASLYRTLGQDHSIVMITRISSGCQNNARLDAFFSSRDTNSFTSSGGDNGGSKPAIVWCKRMCQMEDKRWTEREQNQRDLKGKMTKRRTPQLMALRYQKVLSSSHPSDHENRCTLRSRSSLPSDRLRRLLSLEEQVWRISCDTFLCKIHGIS